MSSKVALLVFSAGLALRAIAADEPAPEPRSSMKDVIRARVAAEEAREKSAPASSTLPKPPPITPTGKAEDKAAAIPAAALAVDKNTPAAKAAAPANTPKSAANEPATVLPRIEVRKERVTKLDVEIARQEHEIQLEKQNTKPTKLDQALNDSKVARALSIFGGESAQFRAGVANERVQLMQSEKEILEAMKLAKTRAERDELQKQLDELRAYRRELEKTAR